MRSFTRQKHGEANPIFREEEVRILSAKDQALACGNPQVLGRNGEAPLIEFLRRYLPPTFRVETGFFATPAGTLSPQIDILVLDSRYPLLSHNKDDSVIVMLHSVIHTIEIKTTVGSREIAAMLTNADKVAALSREVFLDDAWGSIGLTVIGYATSLRLKTVENKFFDPTHQIRECDLILLRVDSKELGADSATVGVELHWEPHVEPDEAAGMPSALREPDWFETTRFTHAPLSDFYYYLVQNSYYTLNGRGFDFGHIGAHMMEYLSWGTYLVADPP